MVGAAGILLLGVTTYGAFVRGWWLPVVPPTLAWLCCFVMVAVLPKRTDPMAVARQFFTQADFQKVAFLSGETLLLRTKNDQINGMVTLWQNEQNRETESIASALRSQIQKLKGTIKLYLVYTDQAPTSRTVQTLRGKTRL